MFSYRQKLLLALLQALGGQAGDLDFQNLLYLLTRQEPAPSYDFIPGLTGPHSFTALADRQSLIGFGLLQDAEAAPVIPAARTDPLWILTRDASSAIGGDLLAAAVRFLDSHPERGSGLALRLHQQHPGIVWRSKLAKQLPLNRAALREISAVRPRKRPPGLLTIGHGDKSLESYLTLLLNARVTLLCDVRQIILLRPWPFSKATLQATCARLDLRYLHLPSLGIATELHHELSPQARDALLDAYETRFLPTRQLALEALARRIRFGDRIALSSPEPDPLHSHRRRIARAIENILAPGTPTEDL